LSTEYEFGSVSKQQLVFDPEVIMTMTSVPARCEVTTQSDRDVSRVIDDISGTSRESLSRMIRESRIAVGYQCEDPWIIEQVRHRWQYFTMHTGASLESGKDAWAAYVKNFHAVRASWRCGYAGSSDYAWGKHSFEVRSSADPNMSWAASYFEGGIMKQLGCVFRRNCMSDGFPEPEVIAAFPGFTPLSATFDWVADAGSFLGKRVENWQYVYHLDFEPPRLGEKRHGSFTAYMAVDYDRVDFERDIQPYKR
jgi:hypothetical protein